MAYRIFKNMIMMSSTLLSMRQLKRIVFIGGCFFCGIKVFSQNNYFKLDYTEIRSYKLALSDSILSKTISKKLALEDMDSLYTLIKTKHVNPFWINSEPSYYDFFIQLKSKLAKLHGSVIEVNTAMLYFQKLLAYIEDVLVGSYYAEGWDNCRFFPIEFNLFSEGWIITKCSESYKTLLGYKLEKINGMPVERIIKEFSPLLPKPNQSALNYNIRYMLSNANILYALGITKNPFECIMTLKNDSGIITRLITSKHHLTDTSTGFVNYFSTHRIKPMFKKNESIPLWHQFINEERALYVRYQSVEGTTKDMIQFATNIKSDILNKSPEKIIIDLRDNTGGNNFLNYPLLNVLINVSCSKKIPIVCLINDFTFSAAIGMVAKLQMFAETYLIGIPYADAPNNSGDVSLYHLKNSQLPIALSSFEWIYTWYGDKRFEVGVNEKLGRYSFQALSKGDDQWLRYVLNYKTPSAIKQKGTIQNFEITGNYRVGSLKSLQVKRDEKDGNLHLIIPGEINIALNQVTDIYFASPMKDIAIEYYNNEVFIKLPGRPKELIKRSFTSAPLDCIYDTTCNLRELATNLQQSFHTYLDDNNLSSEAYLTFWIFNNRILAERLLRLNELLNPRHDFGDYVRKLIKIAEQNGYRN